MASYDALLKNLPPIIGLVVLVLVLLFVLVNFGYLRACDIPGFSGIYYAIKGNPKVAIVTGNDGTGDPTYLRNVMAKEIHMAPIVLDSDKIFDSSALSSYQVVIVEHARTMSTQTLSAFKTYVQGGGKLVWIGDAGTGLADNDYICELVTFRYRPQYTQTIGNQSQTTCLEWVEKTPGNIDDPDYSKYGLCGRTFGQVLTAFVDKNKTIYERATSGQYGLCSDEENAYVISDAERITNCLAQLKAAGKEVTASNANSVCKSYNYWKRGVSENAVGDKIAPLDFSQQALGIDFVKQQGVENVFMTPSGGVHAITKGYETGTGVDFSKYFGVSNISIVDISRFSTVLRTSTVMTMTVDSKEYPAIVTSTPFVQVNRGGLVVYFAFPPDDLIKAGGAGTRLINNLFEFLTC